MSASTTYDRGFTWSDEETQLLLKMWGSQEMQTELGGAKRNFSVYEKISEYMASIGYCRTASQCREKIKRLKREYMRTKQYNQRSGVRKKTMRFADRIETVLNNRRKMADKVHAILENLQQGDDSQSIEFPSDDSTFVRFIKPNIETHDGSSDSRGSVVSVNKVPKESLVLSNQETLNDSTKHDANVKLEQPNHGYGEEMCCMKWKVSEDSHWFQNLVDTMTRELTKYHEESENIFVETLQNIEQKQMEKDEELHKMWIEFEERELRQQHQHEMNVVMMISQLFKQGPS